MGQMRFVAKITKTFDIESDNFEDFISEIHQVYENAQYGEGEPEVIQLTLNGVVVNVQTLR